MNNIGLIAERFQRSADHYESSAIVQKAMAEDLVSHLVRTSGCNFGKILEMGCGIGILTGIIRKMLKFSMLFTNDIVPAFRYNKHNNHENVKFILHDMEEAGFFPAGLSLVISNAAFQWLNDLESFVNNISLNINPGGILAFTTFGENNFIEFSSLGWHGLNYHTEEEVIKISGDYFNPLYTETREEKLFFKNGMSVLRHVKSTGANAIGKYAWTKGKISKLVSDYESQFAIEKGVPLTYNPMFFILRRK